MCAIYQPACAPTVIMPATASYPAEKMAFGAAMNLDNKKLIMEISGVDDQRIKNGKWKEFNKHGVLIAEGIYIDNRKHGLWREYYDHTGTRMIEEHYNHGVMHGCFTSFYPSGQKFSEGEFFNGSREGYFKVYDERGQNIRNLLFINNIQIADIAKTSTTAEGYLRETGT